MLVSERTEPSTYLYEHTERIWLYCIPSMTRFAVCDMSHSDSKGCPNLDENKYKAELITPRLLCDLVFCQQNEVQ